LALVTDDVSFRIFTEPQQGASYADLLAVARTAEDAGFDAFFRSDHFLHMGDDISGLPGPTDAWVTLAGLARETSRIRLGTLVTAATFRLPGPLAVAVAQVDQMSGGRVEFGLGAGWFEAEHKAYGIPFPTLGERFDKYAEQLEIITGLWRTPAGERYNYSGKHYELVDSPALPKPVQQPGPPIVIGGGGKSRTPRLAARYASEFNVPFMDAGQARMAFTRVDHACREIGRDPREITRSVALVCVVGRDNAEISRRAKAIGRTLPDLQQNGLVGTPTKVAERIAGWQASTEMTRIYLQILDLSDLDHIELIGSEVIPQLKGR
jgi:alkanesulfonate monooxygenase